MEEFFHQLTNGLAVGGIYALIALGYTMVYGVLRLINFAHGDLFTLGSYLGLTLLFSLGLQGKMSGILVGGALIVMFVGTVVLMLLLYWFINHTRIGTAIRAVAIDQDTAKLMGINVDNIISMIFLIGPALGGAAGVMMGLYYGQITYDMGFSFGLKAFTAAIMGGIGNIPGAMVGGILLGVLEAMGAAYVSIAWKDAIAFLVLILILIFRPTGLLGERVAEKI